MHKNQMVYRLLLETALENKNSKFVMRDIGRTLGVSPNTVSLAIRPLENIGAVSKSERSFGIINFEKLLNFWAVLRNFEKDIIYRTYVREKEDEIEKRMPHECAFTCYSAYALLFGNDAADYSTVYAYATEKGLEQIRMRFPEQRLSQKSNYFNLVILKPDPALAEEIDKGRLIKNSVPLPQIYVDLWNNREWNASEFLNKLKKRMDDMYAKAIL